MVSATFQALVKFGEIIAMGRSLNRKEKELFKTIARILWVHWDPIGVYNSEDEWDDEYDGYVPSLFKLVTDDRDEIKVANHLRELARISMGKELDKDSEREAIVARLILDSKNSIL